MRSSQSARGEPASIRFGPGVGADINRGRTSTTRRREDVPLETPPAVSAFFSVSLFTVLRPSRRRLLTRIDRQAPTAMAFTRSPVRSRSAPPTCYSKRAAQRERQIRLERVNGDRLALVRARLEVSLRLLFRSLTIWNDPSIEVEYGFDKRRTVFLKVM